MRLEGDRIVIEPLRQPRLGWFDGYQPSKDDDAWSELIETEEENDEWQW
jgi:antitoxin MazE